MDPNVALSGIRNKATQIETDDGSLIMARHEVMALVELFRALDEWLSMGGYRPDDWSHNTWNDKRIKG